MRSRAQVSPIDTEAQAPEPAPETQGRHPAADRLRRRVLLATLCASIAAPGAARADLMAVAAAAKPSVVAVGTYNPLDNPRFTFRGTGFVVGNGHQIATNFHVLPGSDANPQGKLVVAVPQAPGVYPEIREAQIVGSAREHDLALLQVQGVPLPALALASDGPVRDGQAVAMMGFPLGSALGLTPVTHRGIVGATTAIAMPTPTSRELDARTLNRLRQGAFNVYQLDATAYPGNSGSPLLDADTGLVLGIVNMVFVKGTKESVLTAPSGISYAIPVAHLRALLQIK